MERGCSRIGIVGAGFIARRHVSGLQGFGDVKVVAVADPVDEAATALAGSCGARAYASAEEMLDNEQLDGLYICVPPFAHGIPERLAIEHNLPFFVEKPLAVDPDTAEAIAGEVDKRELVTAVGYHWRYLDTTQRALELLRESPPRLALGFWLDLLPAARWWRVESQSGGQFVEQMTHLFDLCRLLVGEVTRVYAAGGRPDRPACPEADVFDVSVATLQFGTGAVGTMSCTCILNWSHRIGLHLVSGGMAIELSEAEMAVTRKEGRRVYPAGVDPYAREDRDFVDAVQGKDNRIRVPYREALATHRLTTAAVRSAREGTSIDLQPSAAAGDG